MKYSALVQLAQDLERRFQGNSYHTPPPSISALVSPPASGVHAGAAVSRPNVQLFAVDSFTAAGDPDLDVVVLIGSNYSQHPSLAHWAVPSLMTAMSARAHPWVEDSGPEIKGARTKLENRLAILPPSYHVLMTNFCPWITVSGWGDLTANQRARLLASPPATTATVSGHLDEFVAALRGANGNVVAWAAHTASIHSLGAALFRRHGCFPRFAANNLCGPAAPNLAAIP